MRHKNRAGVANKFYLTLGAAIAALLVLGYFLYDMNSPNRSAPSSPSAEGSGAGAESGSSNVAKGDNGGSSALFMYCAAGIRPPVEQVAANYLKEYGAPVQLQYGGSNTLLSQIEVAKTGDLYLAADDTYTDLARQKGLVKEAIPLANMRPVIAVKKGNPQNIRGIKDLLRDDVKTALGNPDQAAIGKTAQTAAEIGPLAGVERACHSQRRVQADRARGGRGRKAGER